jgi:hypothetical protein
MGPTEKEKEKTILSKALGCVISGDIYGLKKLVKAGFDLSTENYLCLQDAARLGHTHLVLYIIEEKRPPNNTLKKLSTICADNMQHPSLMRIVRTTGIYSKNAIASAQYSGNTASVDYLMDRETYSQIGGFYKKYTHLPKRIEKLLTYQERKYTKDGEPEKIAFSEANRETVNLLRGVVYKNELTTMLQICCREGLKDAADILYLATNIQRNLNLGFNAPHIFTDEGRNCPLTYTVSFGKFEDYLELKKEGLFLGSELQKHNLGYTINLAIKNNNFEIAEDLIKEGYCPEPAQEEEKPLPVYKKTPSHDMLNSIINNLINCQDQLGATKILRELLNKKHSQEDKKLQYYFTLPRLEQKTAQYILKAIEIGNEPMAKELLQVIKPKELFRNKYYQVNPPSYVVSWLKDYAKFEMIKDNSERSPALDFS